MRFVHPALLLAAVAVPIPAVAQQANGPTSAFFTSNGVRIRYVEQGTGPAVVLLHGFSLTPELNWGLPGVFDGLAANYRVLAVELRGHGQSGKPHQPSAYGAQFATDVVNLLDHLRIPRAHVVGYSLGGGIALKLLTEHPDRVRSAVLGGSGWIRPGDTPPPAVLGWVGGLRRIADSGGSISALLQRPEWPPFSPEIREVLDANDAAALHAVLMGGVSLVVPEAKLRANKVPTLALLGAEDDFAVAAVDRMAAVMPNLTVEKIPGANHATALLDPGFGEAIARFLRAQK